MTSFFDYFPAVNDVALSISNNRFPVGVPVVVLVFVGIIGLSTFLCLARKGFSPLEVWFFTCVTVWPVLILLELWPSAEEETRPPFIFEYIGLAIAALSLLGGAVFLLNRFA
ncbi:hypothetical protein [Oecophyllibacter saccharovorans]|uniref:Uncharacterized protein n=1 Tax=Oecophyllibacter saccharovorans TaxID=2558360 RepID=A0A506UM27_9PROT|nr:hypothetical protein [Oecophyllibacter saccharovorans]TPW34396.1 hypothetical protein E3202_07885 [Oecophyllibacter saccharovorans]